MNKYPLDAQAIKEACQDLMHSDYSQRQIIEQLVSVLGEAMDEMGAEDLDWYDDADKLVKSLTKRSSDYEIHRFNQKNGHNVRQNSPYTGVPSVVLPTIDPKLESELNKAEAGFGEPWTEEELAKHFGEAPPKKKKTKQLTEKALKKMSLEEIAEWEKAQDNSNDIYKVSARIKNLARNGGASLTPAGDMLCNSFTHVAKALYDFAETIEDKDTKIRLIELVKKNEGMPASLIAALNAGVNIKKGP